MELFSLQQPQVMRFGTPLLAGTLGEEVVLPECRFTLKIFGLHQMQVVTLARLM